MILSEEQLEKIIEFLPKKGIILLQGNLGSGKTTLVKQIVKKHNSKENVSSPTFAQMQVYDKNIFHYDFYQKGIDGFIISGLFENLDVEGLHLIEWADESFESFLNAIKQNYWIVKISFYENIRKYEIKECIN